jgi:galactose mutarotase-like enzyme
MSAPVVITSGDLTARIAPLGAELLSLTDRAGREYMTDADPAFWSGHAPLLFPIVGRLNGDVLRVDDQSYPMRQHGFARRMEWEMVGADGNAVTFRVTDTPETRAQYPFAFDLAVLYAAEGNRLSTVVRVSNPGGMPLPFSFGFHPAFAWPLPGGGGKARHRITFDQPEPQDIRRLDGDGLIARHEATPVAGRTLVLDEALFAADALIWDRLASRRLAYRSPDGPWLEVAFDLPQLGIWQKPGANFICIEPWQGTADPAGFAGEFADKPGIILLAPGEEKRLTMDVTVHAG